MSQIAELAVLQRQVKELEDSVKTIERGLSKKKLRLRDEFAMAAMQIMWDAYDKGYCGLNNKDEPNAKTIAEGAYHMADAMLDARGEK